MNEKYLTMTYKEFYEYCENRACDGRWSMEEAIFALDVISKIQKIKVKGLFKKKQTEQAREEAWLKLIKEAISNE